MPIKIVDSDKPLLYRISKLVVHAQFAWWLGHIAVVYASIFYGFAFLSNNPAQHEFYAKVFRGSILSYGIVIWKSHKPIQFNYSFLMKILGDETSGYLLLAIYWLFAPVVPVATVPYFVFSVFHCINYIRTRLFPAVMPEAAEELKNYNASLKSNPSTAPSVSSLSSSAQMMHKVQVVTLERYAPSMKLVALFEVVAIPIVLILTMLMFYTSILTAFIYGQFLVRRASQSKQTLDAFKTVDRQLSKMLSNPKVPPAVSQAYQQVRTFLSEVAL